MRKTTTYVTIGDGSERHNHSINYRKALTHTTTPDDDTVIELLQYKSYKEQINEYMKPFIDEYNSNQDKKYQQDWERYNAGELKTKPKKSNKKYKHEDDDYYYKRINTIIYDKQHNKKKMQTAFDEVVIGFGKLETRTEYTRDEVVAIFENTLNAVKKKFHNLLILGATVHLDEKGNYHMHLDYLPLYFKDKEKKYNGLSVGINIDECMKSMGFQKEESLINKRRKEPLYFNAFRNGIDRILEDELNKFNILVERGVTADRLDKGHLEKDEWLQTKVAANELQNVKNDILVKKNELEHIEDTLESRESALSEINATLSEFEDMSELDSKIKYIKLEQENTALKTIQKQMVKLFEEVIRILEQYNATRELAGQIKKRLERIFGTKEKTTSRNDFIR